MNINNLLMEITKDKKGYKTIFDNLNKENYWIVMTDENSNVWNFEHNTYSSIPDRDYKKIVELLEEKGFVYCYDLPEKVNQVKKINYD